MWPPTCLLEGRAYGSEISRSVIQKDFCNTIGHKWSLDKEITPQPVGRRWSLSRPRGHAYFAISRSLNFWIFPVDVFGNSENTT
jgi:hypothetical protein